MTKLLPHLKECRQAGALHDHVGIECAVTDSIFGTKGGDLVTLAVCKGMDAETLGDEVRNRLSKDFKKTLTKDERCRLWTCERKSVIPQEGSIEGKPLFQVELVIGIILEKCFPGTRRNSRSWHSLGKDFVSRFSTEHQESRLTSELHEGCELLTKTMHGFIAQAQDFVKIEVLKVPEAFRFLRHLLNSADKADLLPLISPYAVDVQLCDSPLEWHQDYLRLGNDYVAVLSMVDTPSQTYAGMFSKLRELDAAYMMVVDWQKTTQAKSRALIRSKQRHHHNLRTSPTSNLTNAAGSDDGLVDASSSALVDNLGECLKDVVVDGESLGQLSLTVVLSASTPAALRDAVHQCFSVFAAQGAHLIEESYGRLSTWLATIPGNSGFNIRPMWFTETNMADVCFPYTTDIGEPFDDHLKSECLATFRTRAGTRYHYSIHLSDVAHTFVVGSTGSGKSFTMNYLLHQAQKYNPLVFVFDLGGSYRSLTRAVSGSWFSFGSDSQSVKINPFSLPPTPENLVFLAAFLRVLIEMRGFTMSVDQEQDLYEQIKALYAIDKKHRCLETLACILPRALRQPLSIWLEGGLYSGYFNHVDDALSSAQFQTFNFEGMEKAGDALEPLLFYILHRASAAVYESPDRFKIFVLDEAWVFLRHPAIRKYIENALRTWRRQNAAMIVCTQSGNDVLNREMLPVFLESMPTQIFLSNTEIDREAYAKAFHLSEREAQLITEIVPKKELILKRPDRSKIVRLDVNPDDYWIYSNKSKESKSSHSFMSA